MGKDKQEPKRMCRTRDEILKENKILKQFSEEVEALDTALQNGTHENGTKKIDVLRDQTMIESAIKSYQNSDDVIWLRDEFENQNKLRVKYPSFSYMMARMPRAFFPLAIALGLLFWLIAGIQESEIIMVLAQTGMKIPDAAKISWAVVIASGILLFAAFISYGNYIDDRFPASPHDDDDCKDP